MCYSVQMDSTGNNWKDRLRAAYDADGRTMREISLSAGMGTNFFSEMLRTPKTPSIENLTAICDVLGVSVSYVILGIEIGQAEEELLRLYNKLPESKRLAILELIRNQ